MLGGVQPKEVAWATQSAAPTSRSSAPSIIALVRQLRSSTQPNPAHHPPTHSTLYRRKRGAFAMPGGVSCAADAASQSLVFETVGRPLLDEIWSGRSGTILAYPPFLTIATDSSCAALE